jgi:hypothetical protein
MRIFYKKQRQRARHVLVELFAHTLPSVADMVARLHQLPADRVVFELDGQRVPCDGPADYSLACRLLAAHRHACIPTVSEYPVSEYPASCDAPRI